MRRIVSLVIFSAAVACADVAHAQGVLSIDVSGIPGSNETTWTFSGSYTVGDVSQTADAYSLFFPLRTDDDNINNFTHETGELTGGIGVGAIFNLDDFPLLSSTAQVSGSQSGVHLLDGIFLDSDNPITGDDFTWYAPGTFEDGETLTFSGTATLPLDITLFLVAGDTFRSIASVGATSTNPADFTMTFTNESAGPSAGLEALDASVELLRSSGTLSSGPANSLSSKLGAAISQVEHQPHAAANILRAFIHQVAALVRTRRLNEADGTNLMTAAENVIAVLTS
jgi:hypothetical protein